MVSTAEGITPGDAEDVQAVDPSQSAKLDTELPSQGDTEETTAPPEGEEPAPEEGEGEEVPEDLDDETTDALIDAYGDKFLASKKLSDRINRMVQTQVEQQVAERTRTLETQGEVANLIERGRRAVTGLTSLAQNAKAELDKAAEGTEFNANVFDPKVFMDHLSDYGQAIVAQVAGRYDGAIQSSIEYMLTQRLPELTDEQAQEFLGIVQTASRMDGDPKQRSNAKAYFVGASMNFLIDRALEMGAAMETERLSKKTTAAEKIAKSTAIKAAAAKLAKDKAPPATPANLPQQGAPTGAFDREYYRKLKATDPQKAQDYVQQYSALQRTPAFPT